MADKGYKTWSQCSLSLSAPSEQRWTLGHQLQRNGEVSLMAAHSSQLICVMQVGCAVNTTTVFVLKKAVMRLD